jgi:tetratricopeptide (TPR) repeat protein
VQTYIDLADLYVQKGLIGEAKSNYLTAAEMHAAAGAKHDSLDIYRRIADLDPNNINIRTKLAAMYEKEEFLEDAAIIYAEIGDALINEYFDDANQHYRRAMDLQPENQEILSRIGYVYAERNLRPKAIAIFETLLTLDPRNIDYQEQLEELQEDVNTGESTGRVAAVLPTADDTSLTFSEEELSSLNFGDDADEHLVDFPLTDISAEVDSAPITESSAGSLDDHMLDFQIEEQGNLVLEDGSSEPEPLISDDNLDLSLGGSLEHDLAQEDEAPAPSPSEPPGDYFDLASRLDTAAQIGQAYEAALPSTARPERTNLKVEAPENLATSEISDIIKEFKQGVLEEVGAEDYETHYELGISYKEMSLLDDAIEEFELAALESSMFVECQGVIGLCYIEKGDYANAIQAFHEARARVDSQSEEYQDLTYQIAVSYEESGSAKEAVNEFQSLYQMNAGYRDVKQRLKRLTR